jgi:Cu-processing system permease protein
VNTLLKVLKYQSKDAARSRWLLAYAAFFMLITEVLLRFSGDPMKVQLSLVSVVLFLVPLVSIVFGTVYLYNAREFIELLLAQPVNRRQMYGGLYLGLTIPLVLAFVCGLGAPFLFHGSDNSAIGTLAWLLTSGVVLTCVFTAVASLIALRCEDRLRGLGAAIGAWMLLTVIYDGFVLFVLAAFSSYPLERAALGLMLANPIDIARVSLLLRFDGAAMMGYTGAVFLDFFGKGYGMALTAAALSLWIVLPLLFGMRAFERKDF